VQAKRPENIKWNQWLTGVRAEIVSAQWASADVVPKRMENCDLRSSVKTDRRLPIILPGFGAANDGSRVSFQRLRVGAERASIDAEGYSKNDSDTNRQ
jgi:hypothetical protein